MNKKEIAEIKKQFRMDNLTINRLITAIVNEENECISLEKKNFLGMDETEIGLYLSFFRKMLTGKIGNKLYNIQMKLSGEEKKKSDRLWEIMEDGDIESARELVREICDKYICCEKYMIMIAYGVYDIPSADKDSEDCYKYMLVGMSPLEKSETTLCVEEQNKIVVNTHTFLVKEPLNGFLYPAFNDRAADMSGALYYAKKPDDKQDYLLEELFGQETPLSDKEEKQLFQAAIAENTETPIPFDSILDFTKDITEKRIASEYKENGDRIKAEDVSDAMEKAGFDEKQVKAVKKGTDLMIDTLSDGKSVSFQSSGFQIKAPAEKLDNIKSEYVNGRKCLIIELDDDMIEINGITGTAGALTDH